MDRLDACMGCPTVEAHHQVVHQGKETKQTMAHPIVWRHERI